MAFLVLSYYFGYMAAYALMLVAQWKVFQKMGIPGWKGIIPGYCSYVLFDELYDNGWRCFMMLIPGYGIYVAIKANIDWAHGFNKSTGFGVGMAFVPVVFESILAFSNAQYFRVVDSDGPVSDPTADNVSPDSCDNETQF